MNTTTTTMPAGKNRCDTGVSTDAAAAGTSLRIRNRLSSQPSVPVLSNSTETPNSAAPRPATSQAVPGPGTRVGRLGHHHEPGEIMVPDRLSGVLRPPGWPTADVVRSPAATIGLQLAFDTARLPVSCPGRRPPCKLTSCSYAVTPAAPGYGPRICSSSG